MKTLKKIRVPDGAHSRTPRGTRTPFENHWVRIIPH